MTVFYSWTARLNYIIYNTMMCLLVCGILNHLTIRFGDKIGLKDKPMGLEKSQISFELKEVD